MASISGRGLESMSIGHSIQRFSRSVVILPKQHGIVRVAYRQRVVSCNAIAMPDWLSWPISRCFTSLFRSSQKEEFGKNVVVHREDEVYSEPHRKHLGDMLKERSALALQIGLRFTGVAIHLANKVITDLRHSIISMREQQKINNQRAAEKQKVLDAETKLQYELQRQRLQLQGKDVAFVKMLHILDRCNLDHDAKWALVQKHTADKAEFSERLQHLFNLAQASKEAVDTLLRPDASRKEINKFWKSAQTMAVIAEEDKLKQLVFAQMLQASQ